jgi:hypothetical protein
MLTHEPTLIGSLIFISRVPTLHETYLRPRLVWGVLSTKLRCGQSGPEAGRSAPVGRTVRARSEQIRVPSFSLRLLTKIPGFARSFDGKGSSPPPL